jgi:predicted RNase H-like nuclease (RuvC/YqgF family)
MRVLLGLISLVCFFSPLKCEGQKSGGLNEEIEDLAHRVSRLEVKILRISNTRSEFDAVSNTVKDIQGKYSRLEALEKHFNESNARIEGLIGKFPRDCQDLYDKNFKLMEVKSGHYLIYPSLNLFLKKNINSISKFK